MHSSLTVVQCPASHRGFKTPRWQEECQAFLSLYPDHLHSSLLLWTEIEPPRFIKLYCLIIPTNIYILKQQRAYLPFFRFWSQKMDINKGEVRLPQLTNINCARTVIQDQRTNFQKYSPETGRQQTNRPQVYLPMEKGIKESNTNQRKLSRGWCSSRGESAWEPRGQERPLLEDSFQAETNKGKDQVM